VEVRPGYKQTDVGVIPGDWEVKRLGDLASITAGGTPSRSIARYWNGDIPWITTSELGSRTIYQAQQFITKEGLNNSAANMLPPGTVLMALYGQGKTRGRVGVLGIAAATNQACAAISLGRGVTGSFVLHFLGNRYEAIRSLSNSGSQENLNSSLVRSILVALPPSDEQAAIATALTDADALILCLEQVLAKKRQLRQGAMQALLTGKKRLPGFTGDWTLMRIAQIASPRSEWNRAGEALTVLTCSKHLGFVESLGYFRNQVFSRDTSRYKVIKRGQIGYPSNHVEEGSIGLQDLYDVALVSPIYVVFAVVSEEVDSYFLHRLLKLDSYRQTFARATSSSVDRRGSLRWPAFSEITVSLPPIGEQAAIASVLRDADAEIEALEASLTKARQITQGMMQELLTGRIRLI
jgi:type I restriction enzyme, S subunit